MWPKTQARAERGQDPSQLPRSAGARLVQPNPRPSARESRRPGVLTAGTVPWAHSPLSPQSPEAQG